MSKSVSKILRNSLFQTSNAVIATGLNFILMLGYAHLLGPEKLGSLVTSQATVLIWIMLIDLGMTNGLIGALTKAEAEKSSDDRQGFRVFDLVGQVLTLRLGGATVAFIGISIFSYFAARQTADGSFDKELFLQHIAYTPHLFAFAVNQTAAAYALFRGRQGLCVFANLAGIFATVVVAFILALQDASITSLLLAQSWGGFLTALIIVWGFWVKPHAHEKENIRAVKSNPKPWKRNALKALLWDVWPHTVALAATTIWQRADQLTASRYLGLEVGGQYGLAIRFVGVPILAGAALFIALFPDLQRVGRDAPEKVIPYMGVVTKFLFRYGVFIAAAFLFSLAMIMVPMLPKFRPALRLLPGFVPGVCAYWMYNFMIGTLFGLRRYKEIAITHVIALGAYLLALPILTKTFLLPGVIASYNIFAISLACLCYYFLKQAGGLAKSHRLYAAYSADELDLVRSVRRKLGEILRKKQYE